MFSDGANPVKNLIKPTHSTSAGGTTLGGAASTAGGRAAIQRDLGDVFCKHYVWAGIMEDDFYCLSVMGILALWRNRGV